MTKKQKIWLVVFGGMFLVPEILWSPVINFVYSIFTPTLNGYSQVLRSSFLFDYKYENMLKIILFVQLAGVILFFFSWLRLKNKIGSGLIFWTILVASFLLCLASTFVFYLGVMFNISLM